MTTRELTEQVLALPLDERVRFVETIRESIDEEMRADAEKEAIKLAKRRAAELSSGAVTGRTHEEVMRTVRRAIGFELP